MTSTTSTLSRDTLSRVTFSSRLFAKGKFHRMVRAKARQLSHENAALKQQIAELTEQLEAEALVDSLRREENQQLLAMLGDTTSGYVALPRNIAKLCRDSLALANLPGNQEAINELDGQINATLKKENT